MIGEEQPGPPKTEAETRFAFMEDANMRRGAKWGFFAGWLIAMYIIQSDSPLGFYTGSAALVFIVWMGLGLLAGLTIGWLVSRLPSRDGES